MSTHPSLRVRRSLQELQDDYTKGDKKALEDLMRAWQGIKALPPDDPRSFYVLGGYHGEPFRGAGWGNSSYWGGYCNHGNVLFPTWHRVYVLKLEEALRSIPGCEDVILPYWDETSEDSRNNGIPWALTKHDFVLDGKTIDNPLRSFVLPQTIKDNIADLDDNNNPADYTKPKGYETVRYPLSGLVGAADRAKTEAHNNHYSDYDTNVNLLNANIKNWLTSQPIVDGKPFPAPNGNVTDQYRHSLDAPNYTVFSNTTSAAQWNTNLDPGAVPVVPLESPHNHIHLAVGGFDVPKGSDFSPIEGANGDMGENDTAALDPIFFFHHCYVDRVFWLWQKKNGFTDRLEIMPEYPGTNSVDAQGPTPGVAPNSWLTLESPLTPFKKQQDGKERVYTSLDCINIEKQLGYTYSPGSLEEEAQPAAWPQGHSTRMVRVSGINRAPISGSFVVAVYVTIGGKKHLVGMEAVLSRWRVQYCANCQTHLEVKAFAGLHGFEERLLENAIYDVEIHTRDGVLKGGQPRASAATQRIEKKLFRIEVR